MQVLFFKVFKKFGTKYGDSSSLMSKGPSHAGDFPRKVTVEDCPRKVVSGEATAEDCLHKIFAGDRPRKVATKDFPCKVFAEAFVEDCPPKVTAVPSLILQRFWAKDRPAVCRTPYGRLSGLRLTACTRLLRRLSGHLP